MQKFVRLSAPLSGHASPSARGVDRQPSHAIACASKAPRSPPCSYVPLPRRDSPLDSPSSNLPTSSALSAAWVSPNGLSPASALTVNGAGQTAGNGLVPAAGGAAAPATRSYGKIPGPRRVSPVPERQRSRSAGGQHNRGSSHHHPQVIGNEHD